MALYRVSTLKHNNQFNQKWENVYTVQTTGDASDCEALGDLFVACERAVSYDTIDFDGFLVYPAAGGPVGFRKLGYVGSGDLASAGLGGILPLFNTVRVTFGNPLGRPEIKYLRTGANANNIGSGDWDGAYVTAVMDDYATPLLSELEYVGPSGELHNTVAVQAAVQMRQLDWHRRVRTGFHRGWVAN